MASKYSEDVARSILKENGIATSGKMIEISANRSIGIRLWGVIDFLCNHCGFSWRKIR